MSEKTLSDFIRILKKIDLADIGQAIFLLEENDIETFEQLGNKIIRNLQRMKVDLSLTNE